MKREKTRSVQSSSTESFTKRLFRLKPGHLAAHSSDSNTCNKQSATHNDQQQGFASVEFVQKAIDNQNDRFSRLEHAIKNLIDGLQFNLGLLAPENVHVGRQKSKTVTPVSGQP